MTAAKGFVCVRVNCTERSALAQVRASYGIKGLPTVVLFNALGRRAEEIVGAAETEIFLKKMDKVSQRGVFSPAVSEPKVQSSQWMDTHRVFLRNGNTVDGRLEEFTADAVVLGWDASTTVQLKTEDVDRVELITIRSVSTAVQEVNPISTGTDKARQVKPVAAKPTAQPSLDGDIRQRIEELLTRLSGASDERKERLRTEMRSFGAEGARYLVWRLQTLDNARSRWVMDTLGSMGPSGIEAELRELLSSARPDIRAAAAQMLAQRGAKDVLPQLLQMLDDREAGVRAAAASGLGDLADADSLVQLADVALDPDSIPSNQAVRAAVELAQRTSSEAALARHWAQTVRRASDGARQRIASALATLGAGRSEGTFPLSEIQEALITLMIDDEKAEVRAIAALALGEVKATASIPTLIERLSAETDVLVLVQICDALRLLKARDAIPALIEQLNSDSADARDGAVRALRGITSVKHLGTEYDEWNNWLSSRK
ncbi:MAG: HEAT repeat domain-containing protein [Planctomycetes bacterium]|nr:HEAT repeat domain-containing protein [Planctomycetota bacterium]